MRETTPKLAFFGDSLTEGYGLQKIHALPAVLEAMLSSEGIKVHALNFGVSGDTSHDGLLRLNHVLNAEPDAAVIEFGANDCFIGEPVELVRKNIATLVQAFMGKNIPVLLVGFACHSDIPAEYRQMFDPIFRELAESLGVPLFPNIIRPYLGNPMLKLMDGLHPNEDGVRAMAEALLPQVRELVESIR
ncbi:GDSL-type esterase/lipase family protein [Salidesulfovibrio onnuriiensis]|uniref:GDSL-type esterase/lipase family protein n=1 Tax=Salidesulfovibrio onnuriiensis TaxID=2583823 RepID=UPI0011CCC892|nr:GDSL-type esterase/lipase family protein [Salidesulfovibrio onnuriiensis]